MYIYIHMCVCVCVCAPSLSLYHSLPTYSPSLYLSLSISLSLSLCFFLPPSLSLPTPLSASMWIERQNVIYCSTLCDQIKNVNWGKARINLATLSFHEWLSKYVNKPVLLTRRLRRQQSNIRSFNPSLHSPRLDWPTDREREREREWVIQSSFPFCLFKLILFSLFCFLFWRTVNYH